MCHCCNATKAVICCKYEFLFFSSEKCTDTSYFAVWSMKICTCFMTTKYFEVGPRKKKFACFSKFIIWKGCKNSEK